MKSAAGHKVLKAALSIELLEHMAGVLRLLAHPHRLKIIEFLEARTVAPVHEIMDHLGLPQATTSQHLNQMKRTGLVRSTRRGKEVWYGIADPSSLKILSCIRGREDHS